MFSNNYASRCSVSPSFVTHYNIRPCIFIHQYFTRCLEEWLAGVENMQEVFHMEDIVIVTADDVAEIVGTITISVAH